MSNPYSKILLNKGMQQAVASVKRVDKDGKLYYMECSGDYYGAVSLPIKAIGLVKKGGCSAFIAHTPDKHVITGRNYDMPHLDKDGKLFGVNLILRCKPAGKYESLAGADSVWLSSLGIKVAEGAYDNGSTKITGLALMPYLCMDGINEKGFTVSILALDLKNGEKPVAQNVKGKKKIIITMMVRYMLDSCANVEEAIELAKSYNLVNTLGKDYHLFITDRDGSSAVLEWRYNELQVIRTDAVTNFYVGEDDAEDCYYPGGLKEKFVAPKKPLTREYHFGYGHGYERFKKLTSELDKHIEGKGKKIKTVLEPEEGRKILAKVAQDYDGMLTSYTQYSVIYDNTELTADYWVQQNYRKKYSFKL